MSKIERVKEVIERISPPDGRGEWDTTRNQNKTLEEATDYLKEYVDILEKESD